MLRRGPGSLVVWDGHTVTTSRSVQRWGHPQRFDDDLDKNTARKQLKPLVSFC